MKIKELITKTEAELKAELDKLRTEAAGLALKRRMSQLKNVHQVKMVKKDIARILTIIQNSKIKL